MVKQNKTKQKTHLYTVKINKQHLKSRKRMPNAKNSKEQENSFGKIPAPND